MSRSILDPRLCFNCTYYDESADLVREFQLLYFYQDQSVDVTDIKTRKPFLKRVTCNNVTREQFYLGATVVVFGRVLKLTEYGDQVTRQLCEELSKPTVIVLAESTFSKLGEALAMITEECQFTVRDLVITTLRREQVAEYALPAAFAGRRAALLQIIRPSSIAKGQDLSRRLGESVCYAAKSADEAAALSGLIAQAQRAPSFVPRDFNSSVIVIKPHAVAANLGGEILQALLKSGLAVGGMMQVAMSAHQADQFLQPYKGVLADYTATVQHLTGNSWVVQLVPAANGRVQDTVSHVREVLGPFDPAIAKVLHPKSLRAKYGSDRVDNAVHCSDLPEDGVVNAEYFFVELLTVSE